MGEMKDLISIKFYVVWLCDNIRQKRRVPPIFISKIYFFIFIFYFFPLALLMLVGLGFCCQDKNKSTRIRSLLNSSAFVLSSISLSQHTVSCSLAPSSSSSSSSSSQIRWLTPKN
jgi:hypothetical protein